MSMKTIVAIGFVRKSETERSDGCRLTGTDFRAVTCGVFLATGLGYRFWKQHNRR